MRTRLRRRGDFHQLRPFAILLVASAVFALLPSMSSGKVSTANVYDVLENFSSLGLVSLALGLTIIAGEFDLSVSSTYLLGGMVAVLTGVQSPFVGVACALACGLGAGLVQGGAIARLRINSIPVTLAGFIAFVGVVFVISHSNSVSYANQSVGHRLDAPLLGIFSIRILVTIGVFALAAIIFAFTWLGRDIRAVGSDRKASRTAGVRVERLLLGVFITSALLTSLGGSLVSYSLAFSAPDLTVAPLIFAATATLLGGVSLSGGRGSPFGIAAGVLTLSLLNEGLAVVSAPPFASELVTGGLLAAVALSDAPDLRRWLRAVAPPGVRRAAEPAGAD